MFFCLSSSQNSKNCKLVLTKWKPILHYFTKFHICPISRDSEVSETKTRNFSHLGLFNPAIITNQETHMIYGNMDGKKNSEKRSGRKRTLSKMSDFFLKTNPISIVAGKFDYSNRTNYSYVVEGKTTIQKLINNS